MLEDMASSLSIFPSSVNWIFYCLLEYLEDTMPLLPKSRPHQSEEQASDPLALSTQNSPDHRFCYQRHIPHHPPSQPPDQSNFTTHCGLAMLKDRTHCSNEVVLVKIVWRTGTDEERQKLRWGTQVGTPCCPWEHACHQNHRKAAFPWTSTTYSVTPKPNSPPHHIVPHPQKPCCSKDLDSQQKSKPNMDRDIILHQRSVQLLEMQATKRKQKPRNKTSKQQRQTQKSASRHIIIPSSNM